jgi:DNA-binding NarL/FixJ family response regulator
MIRVLLADDQQLVRAGFAALLDAADGIEVAGEAADGSEAVRLASQLRPDVVLMDIRMPELDGIEATRKIAARPELDAVHVVILTTFDLDEYVFEGLRAGAAGFLVKDTDAAELIRAVRVAADGGALMSPTVTRRLIAEFASRTANATKVPGTADLTPREREVVTLVARGLSNDGIAGRLYMSVSTVKTHATRAMTKLGARDRAQPARAPGPAAVRRPAPPAPARTARPARRAGPGWRTGSGSYVRPGGAPAGTATAARWPGPGPSRAPPGRRPRTGR